ncbi:hypothetical protein MF672_042595 [Actinomadura sp. ATCC 31491]|uniref:Helix-turn-helix domain-containing protein n=1 Tax=Actinomadura luzonensis TaxID=2805427 RepID=A0ABT0G785_9ACTN|nr:hypothetical protein [Actinomadura luzonensis]MCK2220450.1 hypothetical protein [Actinomadura luzonensis]
MSAGPHLAALAQHVVTAPTGSGKQTAALRTLPELVEDLLAAHVTASRAAGHTWEQVGRALALHPDTARRRFGHPQADADGDGDAAADDHAARRDELGEEVLEELAGNHPAGDDTSVPLPEAGPAPDPVPRTVPKA